MPVYEYACKNCGQEFELRRNISDNDADIKCPKCGIKGPKRVLSLFSTASSGGNCAPNLSAGST